MKHLLIIFVIACIPFLGNATLVQGTHASVYTPSGGSVTPSSMSISSAVTNDAPLSFTDVSRKGMITFGVDHHYPRVAQTGHTKITLSVTYHSAYGGGLQTLPNFTMELDYDPTSTSLLDDKVIKELDGVVDFNVTIVAVLVNGSTATLPANLYLNADLMVDRVYDFSSSVTTPIALDDFNPSTHLIDSDCDGVNDQLLVKWTKIKPAEEYQLEWTFVNDYSATPGQFKNADDIAFDFRTNSTRIVTTDDQYRISLIYDHGYIVYRIRAVGRPLSDYTKRIYGVWSTQDKGTVNNSNALLDANNYIWNEDPWEYEKNWQYSATFAEEGKRKEIVTFFDGTLRSRQTVTVTNTNNKAIVGETIYDHMGRPAVQVLPTPVAEPGGVCNLDPYASLKFYKDFNTNAAGDSYTRKDFDKSPNGSNCGLTIAAMSTATGSSNYYSSSNPNLTGKNAYLPSAEGYPFSQVEFTPDNTGRVRRQGGVGTTFQLGQNHEYKQYYGHPEQIELDRLFGSEVGYASHYQKNMVVDQNGQVSIRYLDQEGRVIITALAGGTPGSAVELGSASGTGSVLTAEMITQSTTGGSSSNVLSADGKSLVMNSTVLISAPTTLKLDYNIQLESYSDECVESLCFNCSYDLNVEVRDECGALVGSMTSITGYLTLDENHNPIFNYECGTDEAFNTSMTYTTAILPIGNYQITKTLSINEDALQEAEERFVNPQYNSCIMTLDDFENLYQQNADYDGCDPEGTCAECVAGLGTLANFIANGLGDADDYQALVDKCNEPCEAPSLCDARKQLLLMDVSPNGQYGEYRMPDNSFHPENFPLSVYNTNNSLPHSSPPSLADWQTPKYELGGSVQVHYYNEDLTTIAVVPVTPQTYNSSGQPLTFLPAVNSPSNVTFNASMNAWVTEPQNLVNTIDFILAFKPSWAYSLIYYHPEYNMLRTCLQFTVPVPSTSYNSSEEFDALMQGANTWEDAKNAGLIKSTWTSLSPNSRLDDFGTTSGSDPIDPAMANASYYDGTSPNLAVMSQMSYKLSHYQYINSTWYSAAQIAAAMTRSEFGVTPGSNDYNFGNDYNGTGVNGTAQQDIDARNSDWSNFKSIYYSIKQELINELAIRRSIALSSYRGYNGCIGNTNFNPIEYDFLTWSSGFFSSEYFNNNQPCYIGHQSLYEYKERRFGQSSEPSNSDYEAMMNQGNYNQYLITGDCPVAFRLERLIDEIASSGSLASSSVSLLTQQEYAGFATALQNPVSYNTPLADLDWVASSTSTTLTVNFVNPSSVSVGSLSMTQTAVTPAAWGTITGIANFQATSTGGLGYQFTANLQVTTSGGTTLYPVTGSTTYDILNCTFDDVCERNDFGSAMYTMFNGLISQNKLATTTSYQIRGGGATLTPIVNSHIQLALGSTSSSTESWIYNAGIFTMSSSAGGSNALKFTVNSTVPSGFTNFASIVSFSDFVVTGPNTFTLVGTDGTQQIRLNITATKVNGSTTSNLNVGSCEPPSLTSCTDQEVDNFNELEALISDVLLIQNQPYDLFASSYLTDNLISQMEPGMTSATSINSQIVVYDDGLPISPREFVSQTETISGNTTTIVTIEREVTPLAILIYTITETCVTDNAGVTTCTIDDDDPPSSTPRSMGKVNQTTFDLGDGCQLTLQMLEDQVNGYTLADLISIETFEVFGEPDDFGNYYQFRIEGTFDNAYRNPESMVIIGSSCIAIRECDEPSMPNVMDVVVPTAPFVDPCAEQVENMAYSNAANAYQQYIDAQLSEFRRRYINKCMMALESLKRTYTQEEYHYTLYYYDQAGNLVKTIPPEGVEPLNITSSSDALEVSVVADRNNSTQTVVTSHRMATTYSYNSLNQLVAQHMPDMDDMDAWGITLANGLQKTLVTTAVQMISTTNGYLAGYVSTTDAGIGGKRGYLYQTTDGGANWTRIDNLITPDLLRVRMISTTTGFAVAKNGMAFRTLDGGDTWDLLDIHSLGIISDFSDVAAKSATSAAFLLANGNIVKYTSTGTLALITPTYTGVTNVNGLTISDINSTGNFEYLVAAQVTASSENFTQMYKIDITTTTPTVVTENIQGSQWNTIRFSSNTEGVIGGIDGDLVVLSEGSAGTGTQMLQSSSNNVGNIIETAFFNKTCGAALIKDAGGSVYIHSTTDGGLNWTKLRNTVCTSMGVLAQSGTSINVVASFSDAKLINYSVTSSGATEAWNTTASLSFDKIDGYYDGTSNYLIGINGLALYKSSSFTSGAPSSMGASSYASLSTSGITAKKLEVQVTGSSIHTMILRSNNAVMDVYTSSGGTTTVTNITAASTVYKDFGLRNDGTNSYILVYDNSGQKIHRSVLPTGGVAATLSSLSNDGTGLLPSGVTFEAIGLHNDLISVVSSNGLIYSCTTSVTSTNSPSIYWLNRTPLRIPKLRSISKASFTPSGGSACSALTVGERGIAFRRVSTGTFWQLVPVSKTTDLNAVHFNTINTNRYLACIAGNSTTAVLLNTVTSAVTDFNISPTQSGNYTDIALIPVSTNGTVYMVGSNGKSYYTNDVLAATPSLSPSSTTQSYSINGLSIATGQSGVPKAVAVGAGGKFLKLDGTTQVAVNAVYGPALNSVHFANTANGTVGGDNFFVRTTTNTAGTWTKVYPQTSTSATLQQAVNEVYTNLSTNGSHFALLGGPGNYLSKAVQNTVTNLTVSGTVNDIAFKPNSTTQGFLAVGTNLIPFTLTASGSNDYTYAASTAIGSGGPTINAIYAFANGGVMGVGTNFVGYKSPSASSFADFSSGVTGTFNDVYFTDLTTGYIVGNAGAFYRTDAVAFASTNNVMTGVSWIQKQNTDIYLTTYSQANINAISFPSKTQGVWGGNYTVTPGNPAYTAYVRLLTDENDVYSSKFYYDRLGRIVVSQNARQQAQNKYAYMLYDNQGRVNEAGEKSENSSGVQFSSVFGTNVGGQYISTTIDDAKLNTWISNTFGTRKEVTKSYYDKTVTAIGSSLPVTLNGRTQRKRIIHITYEEIYDGYDDTYDHATHYDYDIHGNVKRVIQDNPKLGSLTDLSQHRFKKFEYTYDLISVNVHRLDYETGKADQWHQAYTYDADNRISAAYTTTATPQFNSSTGVHGTLLEPELSPYWEREIEYSYYDHGPLARTVFGEKSVQGLDYAYTLQGWPKSVNSNSLVPTNDPGNDGSTSSGLPHVAPDVMGYSLHYFVGDYTPISSSANGMLANQTGSDLLNTSYSKDMYNGNIARMISTITDPNSAINARTALPMGTTYMYDQLNRLSVSRSFTNLNTATNTWGSGGTVRYYNSFTYDGNGNIKTQIRKNENGLDLENLQYRYHTYTNGSSTGKLIRNRLYHVNDDPALTSNAMDDIDDQGTFYNNGNINTANNYSYDAEGRLIKDVQEQIASIDWRVDGKVKAINRTGGSTKKNLKFDYDVLGHRIAKHQYTSANVLEKSTYYVRDGQGNVIAVYERIVNSGSSVSFAQEEKHIYGSERIGILDDNIRMLGSQNNTYSQDIWIHTIGERNYELSNYLGNVIAVVSDEVIPVASSSTVGTPISYFVSDINQCSDYSPFGVTLSGRNLLRTGATESRYGFQDQEEDDEIKGDGNSVSYEYRMCDPRLGRWFSRDLLADCYPNISTYAFCANNPNSITDVDGRVLRDKNGNILYTKVPNSAPFEAQWLGDPNIAVTVQEVYVYNDCGEKTKVQLITAARNMTTGKSVDVSLYGQFYNCHGQSSLDKQALVNSSKTESNYLIMDKMGKSHNKDMKSGLKSDFSKIKKGDIIVYYDKNGVAIHSAVWTGKDAKENKVESKNGYTNLGTYTEQEVYNVYKQLGAVGHGFFTPEPDDKVDIQTGTVNSKRKLREVKEADVKAAIKKKNAKPS